MPPSYVVVCVVDIFALYTYNKKEKKNNSAEYNNISWFINELSEEKFSCYYLKIIADLFKISMIFRTCIEINANKIYNNSDQLFLHTSFCNVCEHFSFLFCYII